MRIRSLTLCGLLVSATALAAQGPAPIPPGLTSAQPHEIVEKVLNQKAALALSGDQITRLTAWHERVADEPHRTAAILTPLQRNQLATLFAKSP